MLHMDFDRWGYIPYGAFIGIRADSLEATSLGGKIPDLV